MEEDERRKKLEELYGSVRDMLSTLPVMQRGDRAPNGMTDISEQLRIFYAYLEQAKELCPEIRMRIYNGYRYTVTEQSSVLVGEFQTMVRGLRDMLRWKLERGS